MFSRKVDKVKKIKFIDTNYKDYFNGIKICLDKGI